MRLSSYVTGVAALLAFVAPIGAAAVRWRARLMPPGGGLAARVAEAVLTLSGLLFVSQVVGTFGGFARAPLVIGCIVLGAVAWVVAGRIAPCVAPAPAPTAEPTPRVTSIALGALLAASAVVYARAASVTLRAGVLGTDSQHYHLPVAAKFFQTGSLSRLYFVFTGDQATFHPFNAEVFHALGFVAFQRDILTPVINLGWLALALVSAWVVGRRWSAGPAGVAAIAVVALFPVMVNSQGGSAGNDMAALALLTATVAVLAAHPDPAPRTLVVAGLAAGLALGTKLTLVVPIAGLTLTFVWLKLESRRDTTRALIAWIVPVAVTGAYWYGRNLVHVGNPVPALPATAKLGLPRPAGLAIDSQGHSIASYALDAGVWRDWFIPHLGAAIGPAWPAIALLAAAGTVLGLVARRNRLVVGMAVTGAVSLLAHLVSPASAVGVRGAPRFFGTNLRYATPAIALLLLAGVLAVAVRYGRGATAFAVLAALGAVMCVASPRLQAPISIAGFVTAFAGVVVFVALRRHLSTAPVVGALIAGALILLAVGFPLQREYLRRRYTARGAYPRLATGPTFAGLWAQNVRGARIGFAGFHSHYPLYGADLSNDVDYIGRLRRDKGFVDYDSCRSWRRAVNRGQYDYVVILPDAGPVEPRQVAWTQGESVVQEVARSGHGRVFRINGRLRESCAPV